MIIGAYESLGLGISTMLIAILSYALGYKHCELYALQKGDEQ